MVKYNHYENWPLHIKDKLSACDWSTPVLFSEARKVDATEYIEE